MKDQIADTAAIEGIKELLTGLSDTMGRPNQNEKFNNPYHSILKMGIEFAPSGKPENIKWGEIKQCFCNAATITLASNKHVYCEGFAMPASIAFPVQHAWNYDIETGKIIDNTWRDGGLAYFGMPFQRNFLVDVILKRKLYGSIIFDGSFLHRSAGKDISDILYTIKPTNK